MKKYEYDYYFAAPLFSKAEIDFNLDLTKQLEKVGAKIFLPQRDNDNQINLNSEKMANFALGCFEKNIQGLTKSRSIIVICDGADVDSGTAWELGFFYSRPLESGSEILLLRTDFRNQADNETGINLMLSESCDIIFDDIEKMLAYVKYRVFIDKAKEK